MTIGFFGGKFIPFHKGHLYCVDFASKICDKVYVIFAEIGLINWIKLNRTRKIKNK